jgi:hypothetical protein
VRVCDGPNCACEDERETHPMASCVPITPCLLKAPWPQTKLGPNGVQVTSDTRVRHQLRLKRQCSVHTVASFVCFTCIVKENIIIYMPYFSYSNSVLQNGGLWLPPMLHSVEDGNRPPPQSRTRPFFVKLCIGKKVSLNIPTSSRYLLATVIYVWSHLSLS